MIGKKLRELRKERGWTQEELGERRIFTAAPSPIGRRDLPIRRWRWSGRWPCCTASPLIICWGCHRGKGKRPLSPVTVGSGGIGWSFFIAAVSPQKIPFF